MLKTLKQLFRCRFIFQSRRRRPNPSTRRAFGGTARGSLLLTVGGTLLGPDGGSLPKGPLFLPLLFPEFHGAGVGGDSGRGAPYQSASLGNYHTATAQECPCHSTNHRVCIKCAIVRDTTTRESIHLVQKFPLSVT